MRRSLVVAMLAIAVATAPAHAASPSHRTHEPAGQTASSLFLPAGAFSPATLTTLCAGTISNADLDDPGFFPGSIHAVTYTSAGRTGGTCQTAASNTIAFDYFPSIFSTVAGAQKSYNDAATNLPARFPAAVTSAPCPSSFTVTCRQLSINWTGGTFSTAYEIQVNQCLLEVRDLLPAGSGSLTAQGQQITQQIALAAVGLARTVCAPADFTIVAGRVEPDTTSLDIGSAPLLSFPAGSPVALVAYVDYNAGPSQCDATATFRILSGDVIQYSVDVHTDTCGNPRQRLIFVQRHVAVNTPGSYTLQVKMDVAGAIKTEFTPFTVTSSKSSTPTAVPTSVPTAAPHPTATHGSVKKDVKLQGAKFESKGAKGGLTSPPLAKAKAGKHAQLVMYLTVTKNAVPRSPIAFTFVAQLSGKTVVSRDTRALVGSKRPSTIREAVPIALKKPGTYLFTGSVTYQGVTQTKSTTIAVSASKR